MTHVEDCCSDIQAPAGWVRYFEANAAEPSLPWDDRYRLTGAERAAVLASIQQFQLGEGAQGRRLLERAKALVRCPEDAQYLQALHLFVREEQRHSHTLGRFLALHQLPCLRRHWIHRAFRLVRGLAGLELFMRVLATAEVIAIPYYTALREATGSPLLRAICGRILEEEAAHLRFQAFTFSRLCRRHSPFFRRAAALLHRYFLEATTLLVWLEHRLVFCAGGYSLEQLHQHCLKEFQALYFW